MSLSSYRELKVWQQGIENCVAIYRATGDFPKHELYGLTSQMRRASVSIPSNIAEGHSRDSTKEFLRHLSIVLGSLAELETQLTIAERLGYLRASVAEELIERCDYVGRMLRNLQRSLRLKLQRDGQPPRQDDSPN
jgi:four helix bundle protein